MQKLSDNKVKITYVKGQNSAGAVASKRAPTFFGLFTSPSGEISKGNTATALKESAPKSFSPNVPRADLAAVKSWVALEEKIVHDYREQKKSLSKHAVSLPKSPVKQPLQAFETFTTQTAVSLPQSLSKPKGGPKGFYSGVVRFLLVCGGLAAAVFMMMHAQKTLSSQETSQKLMQFESEKNQLERSYVELKRASANQGQEVQKLSGQLRDAALQLRTAKANKVAFEQGLEKKYREELMNLTMRYEAELDLLRGTVQTQTTIIEALKAQGKAFDAIVDQAGMSALSGAAAGFSRSPQSAGGTAVSQGEITSVSGRQGSVVINLGSEQGARSGREIAILRNGVRLTAGLIDRVYPTMSVALIRDTNMLQVIQAGDSVSFS